MRKSRYSDEEITAAVERNRAGVPLDSIIAELGVSAATFYVWRKSIGRYSAGDSDLAVLRDENVQVKKFVATAQMPIDF